MPYIYTIRRRVEKAPQSSREPAKPSIVEPVPVVDESYRDLQAHAKELGISAKQTAAELKAAIAEAERNG